MGHAISRTKPSIVAFDIFAREPSIDVFCGGWGAAVIDATPQPANKQKRKLRFIRTPFHQESIGKVTGLFVPPNIHGFPPFGRRTPKRYCYMSVSGQTELIAAIPVEGSGFSFRFVVRRNGIAVPGNEAAIRKLQEMAAQSHNEFHLWHLASNTLATINTPKNENGK
jgi:hypothetical protein